MSRVPADTVLLRFAVAAALVLPIAGCGDDNPTTASTPASTPPAVTQTTLDVTTPEVTDQPTTPAKEKTAPTTGKGEAAAPEPTAKQPPADTKETAAKASPKQQSNDELASDMKKAHDALKAAGLNPSPPLGGKGQEGGAFQVKDTNVLFYPSPRLAAESSARFSKVLTEGPQNVKIARRANRLFLMSLPMKPTAEQLADFRKVRQIVNGAV